MHIHASLAYNEYSGHDDDTKMFHRFSQEDTHRTQQISLLTVLCYDNVLSVKWKWIVIKVFILTVYTLNRQRKRGLGLAVPGVAEAEERRRKWRQAHSV